MFTVGMTKIESPNILDYVDSVAQANIGPINIDQQKTDKKIQ